MGRRVGDEIERFWSKVKTGKLDECWLWTGAKRGTTAYGLSFFEGRKQSAHRVSYQINVGPIPDGLDVCHTCDNPLCVNPAHLWLGTHQENMADMHRKGRGIIRVMRGESDGRAKLTEAQVVEILGLLKQGFTHRAIAKQYGVSQVSITHISQGKNWKHVPR